MGGKCFFFAGGGTGGHIYPAIAVAEQIIKLEPAAKIHFFCSMREIDSKILGQTGLEFTPLPATGFSFRPGQFIKFCTSFIKSYRITLVRAKALAGARKEFISASERPAVIAVGGFVAAPVCFAAHKLKAPMALLNIDMVPGRANKIIGRWADEIFVQFEETKKYFGKTKAGINVVGCPLRSEFSKSNPDKAIEQLGLDRGKKILLIMGGSSGAENINQTACSLLNKLAIFADDWQIVHLTGDKNYETVKNKYNSTKISHKVLGYFDKMADLLAAADLLVGRSGAVSVAEYAATGVPSICMPYPYHKDMHQYLNAGKLVEVGAAIIVDDVPDEKDRAEWLWDELQDLMKNDKKRQEMKDACKKVARLDAADKIAERLLQKVSADNK